VAGQHGLARSSRELVDAGDRERLTGSLRRERDRCQAAGADTAWIDQILGELEPLTADLDAAQAIRAVIERHGPGPYPADELATIAGIDVDETPPRPSPGSQRGSSQTAG
jgi:hypothetical protein